MRKLRSREKKARKWLNQNFKPSLSKPHSPGDTGCLLGIQQGTILTKAPALGELASMGDRLETG